MPNQVQRRGDHSNECTDLKPPNTVGLKQVWRLEPSRYYMCDDDSAHHGRVELIFQCVRIQEAESIYVRV